MKSTIGRAKAGLLPSLLAVVAVAMPLVVAGQDRAGAAQATCDSAIPTAEAYGPIAHVIRAEASNVQEVVAWQEGRFAEIVQLVSPLRGVPATTAVTICLYRGDFVAPAGPPEPKGEAPPPRNALRLLLLADGSVFLDSFGWDGQMAPETPSDWRGS